MNYNHEIKLNHQIIEAQKLAQLLTMQFTNIL